MKKEPKRINLALQGGGAYGALTWGVLDMLLEDGRVQFDSISATSAGAMNAVLLAQGLDNGGNEGAREVLSKFWRMISELYNPISSSPIEQLCGVEPEHSLSYMMFGSILRMFSPYQFNPVNFNPLRDILEKTVDFKKLQVSQTLKIFLSATNVKSGKIKVFDNKELSVDAVMASACLPSLFQSVKIGDEYFWDGGYMGNPALFPLIYNSNCPDILIININPLYREQVPGTSAEILDRINEISFNSSLMREMRVVSFITQMLDNGWIKDEFKENLKRIYIHTIRADRSIPSCSSFNKLNTEWTYIHHLFEEGRKEGAQWLKDHSRFIGKKSTTDMNAYL